MPWGITFTDPFAAANVGTPLGVPLHPTQLYEAGAELLILGILLLDRAQGPAVRRPDVLALHAALRDLALHHRVLPRRRARHGRDVLDLAVHLARARAAGDRDAGLPGAREDTGAEARARRPRDPAPSPFPTRARALRLDRFLVSVLPEQSRSQIQRLIKDGHVLVDGRAAKPNQPVKTGQDVIGRHPRADRPGAAARSAAAADPLPGSRSDRRRQAGGHGRPSGRRPRKRHARQRAAPPRRRSERHRRRKAAGHRPSARPRHVGADGGRQARRGARGAGAPVPRPRSREGIHRARLGRGEAGRRIDAPIGRDPGEPQEDVGRARGGAAARP